MFGKIGVDATGDMLHPTRESIGQQLVMSLKGNIEFLINYFDVFERDNFNIKELPLILKSFYELDKDVSRMMNRSIIKDLLKKGYSSLVYLM